MRNMATGIGNEISNFNGQLDTIKERKSDEGTDPRNLLRDTGEGGVGRRCDTGVRKCEGAEKTGFKSSTQTAGP